MAQGPSLNFGNRPELRPTLRTGLRAGLRQGMAMLALPAIDLHAELSRLAADNPFLIVDPPTSRGSGGFAGLDIAARLAAPVSLADHIQTQIACMDLAPGVRALALFLAADLDQSGYLNASDAEIAAEIGVTAPDVAAARAALQTCEPTGIGARGLAECLALQLIEKGVSKHLAHMPPRCLQLLAAGRLDEAAALLEVDAAEADALRVLLKTCTPEPAAAFAVDEARPLLPELTIEATASGTLDVRLLDDPTEAVRFDETLLSHLKHTGGPQGSDFAKESRFAARRLVTALRFRSRTLLRVGMALAEAQSMFFLGRTRAPAALSRAELAARLGLHPATVGRAVKGRGVLFSGQVRPLGWFFPAGHASGDKALSQTEIMARLRDLIACETPHSVLNDDAIALRLRDDGVDIARRTVAKYRKCLDIPSSSHRRRLLARKATLTRTR
ncbi:MAG: hypothetical protein AAF646_00310 [Pseudomonadota bacterium]